MLRHLIPILAVSLLMSGCNGYRLGSSLPPDIRSVYVPTFLNKTTEPLVETEVTAAIIREFQRDGTLKTTTASAADIHVVGEITRYELKPLAYDGDTRRAANEYRMYIYANITVTQGAGGPVLLQARDVEGYSDFILTGDLGAAKRDNLPATADDLARRVIGRVVEFW